MIKAVFFDVDGTLIPIGSPEMPDSTRQALEELKRRGILRVVATGRHMMELSSLSVGSVDFDGYLTLNGQLCFDGAGRLIFGRPITGEAGRRILALFERREFPVMLVERERMYVNYVDDRLRAVQAEFSTGVPATGEYAGGALYQAVAFFPEEREAELAGRLPGCRLARWNRWAVDIVSGSGGKAAGLRQYLERHGLEPGQAMAFGDGENDADMLACAGVGVAMGNAHPAARRAADYVTGEVGADGIAEALRRYHIL